MIVNKKIMVGFFCLGLFVGILFLFPITDVLLTYRKNKLITDQDSIIEEQKKLLQSYVQRLKEDCPDCPECGVYPLENGYIIDGYYYEFKGEADIQMEQ